MESIKSTGQIFPDGRQAIEIVRQADNDLNKLALLHWDGEHSRISSRLELDGKIYEPAELPPTLVHAVRLPIEIRPFGSPNALVKNLTTVIVKYSGLPDHLARLAAFFLIATWLSDVVGTAPRLIVLGAQGRAANQVIKMLSRLCRHAIVLADVTPGTLSSLPFTFGLTLLIRQSKITERLRQFLLASSMANQFIVHGGRFIDVFCPVVLQVEGMIGNPALIAGIELPMLPTREEIPFLDCSAAEAIAKEFQGQLLAYRLANLQATRRSDFDPSELTTPVREIARSIGVCFSSDPDLQAEIVLLLRNTDAHAQVLSATCQEAVTAEAMLFLCHENRRTNGGGVYVGEIADKVRVLNRGREEITTPSPRAVGEILRTLGFQTTRLDKNGRGIMMFRDICRRVHYVAMNYGLPLEPESMPECDDCKILREHYAQEGKDR